MGQPPAEIAAVETVPRRVPPAVVLPVLALLAVIGGQLPSFSVQANLYVLAVGGALTWLGLSGQLRRYDRTVPGEGLGWWLLPIVVFAPLEMVNYALGSSYAHPTISVLLDPVFAGEPAKTVLYFGWLAVFWGLVHR